MEDDTMKKYFLLFLFLLIPVSIADVSIVAPAVAETDYGYVGAPISIDVKVSTGSGHVYMDTMPMTQMDMQGSARIASKVAFDITGKNQNNYDVYYIVRSDVPVIGGPSAGATLCVATIASLNNWSINKNVMMTGMINPDGSVGPVGGILEKIKAAKSMNVDYFLIPHGERYVSAGIGENDTVDAVEYGKEMGIKVIEVKSINEALYYFTNHKLTEKNYGANLIKENIYQKMMKSLSEDVLKEAKNNYKDVKNRLDYESKYNTRFNYNLKTELTYNLEVAEGNINIADELYLNKSYYASTSKAFGVLITLEYINNTINYIDSDDGSEYVKEYLLDIQKDIDSKKELINNQKMTKDNFEYIMASKSRIYEADELMSDAWKSYYDNKPLEALNYGSYAKLRAKSSIWWLNLYKNDRNDKNTNDNNDDNNDNNYYINENDLKYLAQEYLDNSEIVVLYSTMVFPNIITEGAQEKLDDAKKYYNKKEYLLSISKSIDAQVYATTSLNYMEDIEYLKDIARKKINKAENYENLIPVSALGYYEYADSFNDSAKILYYKYSMAYAQMDMDILKIGSENNYVHYSNNTFIENDGDKINGGAPLTNTNNAQLSSSGSAMMLFGLICGIIIGYIIPRGKKKEENKKN